MSKTAIVKPPAAPSEPPAASRTAMKRFESGPIVLPVPGTERVEVLKRGDEGSIKQVRVKLQLTEAQGDLWSLDGRPQIAASAYYRANQIFGAIPLSRDKIMVDGRWHENPYTRRDDESGAVLWSEYEAIWVARNPLGNLTVMRYRMRFDPRLYRAQALMKAWAPSEGKEGYTFKDKQSGEVKTVKGRAGRAAAAWGQLVTKAEAKKTPGRKLVPITEDDVLIVDLAHPAVIDVIKTYMQLQQFADRRVVTMCDRNALKKMMGVFRPDPDGKITVIGWSEADATLQQFVDLAAQRAEQSIEQVAAATGATFVDEQGEPSPEDVAGSGGDYEERESVIGDASQEGDQGEQEGGGEPAVIPAEDAAPSPASSIDELRAKVRDKLLRGDAKLIGKALMSAGIKESIAQVRQRVLDQMDAGDVNDLWNAIKDV